SALEGKVVVQPPGVVALHDEARAARALLTGGGEGLRRPLWISFASVLAQPLVHGVFLPLVEETRSRDWLPAGGRREERRSREGASRSGREGARNGLFPGQPCGMSVV